MKRILLADLGALDPSAVLPALGERYGAAVVVLVLDVGQQGGSGARRSRALAAGAVRAHLIDAREAFANDLLRLLHAGALRAGDLSLPDQLLRGLTAAKLVEVAAMEGTPLLAHPFGAGTRAGQELERTVARLHEGCFVVSAGPAATESLSAAETLWWRRLPPHEADAAVSTLPDVTATLDVRFVRGVPLAINGVEMPLVELIEVAGTIAGDHGVGRVPWPPAPAHPVAGAPAAPSVFEAPGAAVLTAAHEALTRSTISPGLQQLRRRNALVYARMVREGEWVSDVRLALDAFAAEAQARVTGTVRLHLRRGRCRVTGLVDDRPATAAGSPRAAGPPDAVVSH